MSCAVRLENVSVTYHDHIALHGVSLQLHRGDFAGVIGPNGAGKTTLLTVINGLGRIRAGTVEVLGEPLRRRGLRSLRARIGYVPQHVSIDPRSPVSCREAVMIGRLGRIGLLRRPGDGDRAIVERVMKLTRVAPLAERPVGRLSGGELQKVALSRALAQEPEILLLDEPTANLDPQAVVEIRELIVAAHAGLGLTVVMVTHQVDHLPEVCGRVVMMRDGRIVSDGDRRTVMTTERLAELFRAG